MLRTVGRVAVILIALAIVIGGWVACSRSATGRAIGEAHRGHQRAAASARAALGPPATERPPPPRGGNGPKKSSAAGELVLGVAGSGAKIGVVTVAVWLLGKARRRARRPTPRGATG